MKTSINIYCTSYCNKGHDMKTGRPVDHECYILPPKALKAEYDGDISTAIELIEQAKPLKISAR